MPDKGDLADVLIVGAGASGSLAANHLANAGFKVVCIEQGNWVNASDYPGSKPEWELLAGGPWHADPNVRREPQDYPCDVSDSAINVHMYNGVGGGTLVYAANWSRLTPSDFRTRTLDGVGDDWPFTYEDLVPYYESVDAEVGVAGLGGDTAYPPGIPPPLPAHPINKTGRRMAEGLTRLGWHWWPGPNTIASRAFGGLSPCVRRGTCRTGCPDGAKNSFDLTYWPGALRAGAQLITRARVREITTDTSGRTTGVTYVDGNGVERRQRAQVVVLAANAIGSARLLLLSRSSRFPHGLANSSGLVGRRLMMHPVANVVGLFTDDLDGWLGISGQTITSMEFYETDASRGFARGAKWHVNTIGGPLGILSCYQSDESERKWWGAGIHSLMRRALAASLRLAIVAEDLPEEENRVTLDPMLKDPAGVPAPKVTYRISTNTTKLVDFHIERAKEALAAAGAYELLIARDQPSGHLVGTTRMGFDPTMSVVNSYGQAHDVPNLYVYDGGVFPTAGGVNPTATICAVAARSVKHLIATARLQKVPV